jgi:phosphinothricin acetyltransferase
VSFQTRPGREDDLEQLNGIYNHYIRETAITFDIEEISMDERREWFSHYGHTGRHRLFVAVADGRILGFATSSPWRPKRAYETSVETTIYVLHGSGGRGVGTGLYTALFDSLAGEDVHRAYAGITQPNEASVALHERFGFSRVAYFTEQGRKFGRYWDVAWYERPL